jgi:hypothetical protein
MATQWTLPDHPTLPKGKQVAVIVLDGWGEASADQYNCIHRAETPVMDSLKNVCALAMPPLCTLSCCAANIQIGCLRLLMVASSLRWCIGQEFSFHYHKTDLSVPTLE